MPSVTKIILDRLDDEGILTDYLLASNVIDSTLAQIDKELSLNFCSQVAAVSVRREICFTEM